MHFYIMRVTIVTLIRIPFSYYFEYSFYFWALFFRFICFVYIQACWMFVCAVPVEVSDPVELEPQLWAITWVLGLKPRYFRRTANALTCWAISLAPSCSLLLNFFLPVSGSVAQPNPNQGSLEDTRNTCSGVWNGEPHSLSMSACNKLNKQYMQIYNIMHITKLLFHRWESTLLLKWS